MYFLVAKGIVQLDSLIHRVYIHFWFHMGYNKVYMFQSRGSYARFSVCLEYCLIYLAFEQSTLSIYLNMMTLVSMNNKLQVLNYQVSKPALNQRNIQICTA